MCRALTSHGTGYATINDFDPSDTWHLHPPHDFTLRFSDIQTNVPRSRLAQKPEIVKWAENHVFYVEHARNLLSYHIATWHQYASSNMQHQNYRASRSDFVDLQSHESYWYVIRKLSFNYDEYFHVQSFEHRIKALRQRNTYKPPNSYTSLHGLNISRLENFCSQCLPYGLTSDKALHTNTPQRFQQTNETTRKETFNNQTIESSVCLLETEAPSLATVNEFGVVVGRLGRSWLESGVGCHISPFSTLRGSQECFTTSNLNMKLADRYTAEVLAHIRTLNMIQKTK